MVRVVSVWGRVVSLSMVVKVVSGGIVMSGWLLCVFTLSLAQGFC